MGPACMKCSAAARPVNTAERASVICSRRDSAFMWLFGSRTLRLEWLRVANFARHRALFAPSVFPRRDNALVVPSAHFLRVPVFYGVSVLDEPDADSGCSVTG